MTSANVQIPGRAEGRSRMADQIQERGNRVGPRTRPHTFEVDAADTVEALYTKHLGAHPPTIRGWLERHDKLKETWSRRYFVLKSGHLSCSRRPVSAEKELELPMSKVASIRTVQHCDSGFELRMKQRWQPSINLRAPGGAEEAHEWLFAFHRSVSAVVAELVVAADDGVKALSRSLGSETPPVALERAAGDGRSVALHTQRTPPATPHSRELSSTDGACPPQPPLLLASIDLGEDSQQQFDDCGGDDTGIFNFDSEMQLSSSAAIAHAHPSCRTSSNQQLHPFDPATLPAVVRTSMGPRQYMEDACAIVRVPHLGTAADMSGVAVDGAASGVDATVVCVCDGHAGSQAADDAAASLPSAVAAAVAAVGLYASTKALAGAITGALRAFDDDFTARAASASPPVEAGCTALICFFSSSRLITANIGDCRAVLSRGGRAVDLNTEHKPDRPDERKRIEAAGGWITIESELQMGKLGSMRLRDENVRRKVEKAMRYVTVGRVCGELGVSRALGDFQFKMPYAAEYFKDHGISANLVSAEAEVTCLDLGPHDEFVIAATDGLWDVMSSTEVVDFVHKCRRCYSSDPGLICDELIAEAVERGTLDNTSVVYVALR